jgi:hypothetical protein
MPQSDFAWAPDAAPTGKTFERVKERFSFYAFYFHSQSKTASHNRCESMRVQALNKLVTRFGAGRFCFPVAMLAASRISA